MRDRQTRERELDRLAPLRSDDSEPPALARQRRERILHADTRLERVVQRLVVRAVHRHELLDARVVERLELRFEPGATDARQQFGVGELALEHRARCMAHRGEDDPAGVDDGAVEIEEHDRKAHGLLVSNAR